MSTTNLTPYEREISSRATRAIAWQSSPIILRLLRGDIPALLQTISELRQLVEDSRARDKELADLRAQIAGMKRETRISGPWGYQMKQSRSISDWADEPEGKDAR